ncbi:MAG: hypothetical protein HYZ53_14165 [Planctomycetes bacterium]|nr:hypothetical protein [Planctomycetota bacterium]
MTTASPPSPSRAPSLPPSPPPGRSRALRPAAARATRALSFAGVLFFAVRLACAAGIAWEQGPYEQALARARGGEKLLLVYFHTPG